MIDEPVIYLVELTCYVPGEGVQVLRFSSGSGYVSAPSDNPSNTWYEPRVSQPGLFRQDMYREGATGGSSRGGHGEIVLVNGAGELDALIDYGFDGRAVVVREGRPSWPLSQFAVVITGTAEQPVVSWDTVTIRLRDRAAELAGPVQPNRYAGDNVLPGGIEGTAELKGKAKPRLLGVCNNVTPPCVNTSRLIYQVNDGPVIAVSAVYDSGVPLTPETADYIDQAHMESQAPEPGTYRVWPGGGCFRLGATPAGQITCDARSVAASLDIAPSSLSVVRGTLVSGTVEDLAENDGADVLVAAALDKSRYLLSVEVGFNGVTGLDAVKLSASVSSADPANSVWVGIWNWPLNRYDQFEQIYAGAGEITVWPVPDASYLQNGRVLLYFSTSGLPYTSHSLHISHAVLRRSEASRQTAGQFIKLLAAEKLGSAAIIEQSINDLDRAAPYRVGLYTGTDDKDTSTCLDELAASVGAWWGFDNAGSFWAKQLQAPDPLNAVMLLTQSAGSGIERLATADSDRGVPVWRVNIDYAKNWTVQTSGLAGSVGNGTILVDGPVATIPLDRAAQLAMEFHRETAVDEAVRDKHRLAPEMTAKTLLVDRSDAVVEAARQLSMRSVRRDLLRVPVSLDEIVPFQSGFWDLEAGASLPYPLHSPGSIVDSGKFYVIGGVGSGSTPLGSTLVLDLAASGAAWSVSRIPDMASARYRMGVAVVDVFLYVLGGYLSPGNWSRQVLRTTPSSTNPVWATAGTWDLPLGGDLRAWGAEWSYIYALLADGTAARMNNVNPGGGWQLLTPFPAAAPYQQGAVVNGYWYVCGSVEGVTATYRLDLSAPTGPWERLADLPTTLADLYLVGVGATVCVLGATKTYRLDTENLSAGWDDLGIADLPASHTLMGVGVWGDTIVTAGGTSTGSDCLSGMMIWQATDVSQDISRLYDMGRTVMLDMPRYGYSGGRAMRIIGTEADYRARTMKLDLWG